MSDVAVTVRESSTSSVHLCGCGVIILERRLWLAGQWQAQFTDLEGNALDVCPGCGRDLDKTFGPSEAERQRERSLPPQLIQRGGANDELFR